jgi:hypothetical protein
MALFTAAPVDPDELSTCRRVGARGRHAAWRSAGSRRSVTRLLELREAPLSLDECFAAAQRPEAGGVAIFIGTVRNQNQGQDVARLEYQAYPSMAQKELGASADEIERERPGTTLACCTAPARSRWATSR